MSPDDAARPPTSVAAPKAGAGPAGALDAPEYSNVATSSVEMKRSSAMRLWAPRAAPSSSELAPAPPRSALASQSARSGCDAC